MNKVTSFFRDVFSEMRKTSWPKSKELTKYTIVVTSTVIIMALFFLVVDYGISELFRWYLDL
ncbi:MAG: preprotein translocase subunit SecE [Caryophanon sp.]|uniref:Protein translocase subunit SecE n=1 Tax=Caryophanon latum TaxID=33977 RepID=A0A1C0YXK1_9BACL|nr:preprotein translocase subunit SecE [Caryophanon latum]MEE1130078.1 preprotein translocase subunit SecE [Caryophanon sp.]OCS91889.1 preprotein translocase subunit SecE [Caryophanon latum]